MLKTASVPHCLLCHSTDVLVIDGVSVAALAKAYGRAYAYSPDAELAHVDMLCYCLCQQCDLRFFWPPRTGSEAFYRALQRRPGYYLPDKPEYQMAKRHILHTHAVLEIGCGYAAFAALLPTADYTGLEFSSEAADHASRNGLTVFKQSIEDHAKHHPGRYDVVCSFQVLEHVADVKTFITASLSALKPNGLLIYCVPSAESYISRLENCILNMPPHHVTHWTDAALGKIANLFSVELVALEHEVLAERHIHDYAFSVALSALNKLLGRKHRMFDRSLLQSVLSRIAFYLAYLLSFGLNHVSLLPQGHSVIAVYRNSSPANVEPYRMTTVY